ncbi:MAG: ATP-binding protein [Candidatus Omnitrophica bacterium]|nr:ATP-binding protein [Candidatus Omnitrophota bacterium]MDD5552521.1 ATP-binding protein [Candidatus Omnitrophota bacterium]
MARSSKQAFNLQETLNTDLKKIPGFVHRVSEKIFALTGKKEEAFHVKLSLEEALSNAMRHGNKLKPGAKVIVKIKASPKMILLDVHDEGKGFDSRGLSDPTNRENLRSPSGRGVFLMRKLMDKVEFYDGGSGVRIRKKF